MLGIIISFVGLVLSVTFILLLLNYATFLYQSRKLNDLADSKSKLRPEENNVFLTKSSAERSFTTKDLGENFAKIKNSTPESDERKVVFVDNGVENKWLQQLNQFIKRLRVNFWGQLKRIITYLINLTKPTEELINGTNKDEAKVEKDVVEAIERVQSVNNHDEEENEDTSFMGSNVIVVSSKASSSESEEQKESETSDGKQLFEKLEAKILDKLKKAGLDHFDIWIELASLYEKYDEIEKAKQMYQIVLNKGTGKEKEIATKKMIELS